VTDEEAGEGRRRPARGSGPGALPPAGLCADCRHRRLLASRRSTFLTCARAATDPAYPRYPRLPVLTCPGFEAGGEERPGVEDPARVG